MLEIARLVYMYMYQINKDKKKKKKKRKKTNRKINKKKKDMLSMLPLYVIPCVRKPRYVITCLICFVPELLEEPQ